jgi:hypothetical protein
MPLTQFCRSSEFVKIPWCTPKDGKFSGKFVPFVPVAIALYFSLLGWSSSVLARKVPSSSVLNSAPGLSLGALTMIKTIGDSLKH